MSPDLVTTPSRSPSPSKARPSSASPRWTRRTSSARFSGLLGSGWWFGKLAVDLRIQLVHRAAERAQDAGRRRAGDAVAGIDRDRHRSRELAVGDDARAVLGEDVHRRRAAAALHVVIGFHAPTQSLDLLAVDRAAADDHLEAVVVLRVVAARDLDAARAAVRAARRGDVVQHRRRHRAEVDDVEPGRREAAHERGGERRAREAAVAADRDGAIAGGQHLAAEGTAELLGEPLVDRLADDAADVVGLEDRSVDVHDRPSPRGARRL